MLVNGDCPQQMPATVVERDLGWGGSSCPLLAETLEPFFSFPLILFASFLFPRMLLALPLPVRLCGADVTGAEVCKECGGREKEAEAYAGVSVGGGEEGEAYG